MPDSPQLTALRLKARAAVLRHVARPSAFGAADEHLRFWAAANEARYATLEGNLAFAAKLLPRTGEVVEAGEGIPLLPAGVRWVVDEDGANTITVSVDVAAAQGVVARVTPPTGAAFTVAGIADPTRATFSFPAGGDGLYAVALLSGGSPIATVYVPVTRSLHRSLREDSRALGYQFRRALPPTPSADYRLRLALLIGAESAAQTGQVALALSLLGDAGAVTPAPSPVALYPYAC